MTTDIIGSQPTIKLNHVKRIESTRDTYPRLDSKRLNPITGEEYMVNTEYPNPVSFMKENNSNKSRRLARILENFNNASDYNQRSRSNLKYQYSETGLVSPVKQEQNSIERIVSHRKTHNTSENKENKKSFLSSRDLGDAVLPSFSKRMMGHKMDEFKAYEDNNISSVHNRSRKHIHEDANRGISKSFVIPDLRSNKKEPENKR